MQDFLPVTRAGNAAARVGTGRFRLCHSGDAYVDHPSFGTCALSAALLESQRVHGGDHFPAGLEGYGKHSAFLENRVWDFLSAAGNMDSMVNHYTVSKERRQKDAYTPGRRDGKSAGLCSSRIQQPDPSGHIKTLPLSWAGLRPAFAGLAHYDYWSNKVKRSSSCWIPVRI